MLKFENPLCCVSANPLVVGRGELHLSFGLNVAVVGSAKFKMKLESDTVLLIHQAVLSKVLFPPIVFCM